MSGALNLFPARIRWVNPDGTLTAEALRMLSLLVSRVGGTLGDVGADLFGAPDVHEGGGEQIAQAPESPAAALDLIAQLSAAAPALPEMVLQRAQISSDEVDGLGTMATQNIGTNFSGSFTGKTVTVTNGIITAVV